MSDAGTDWFAAAPVVLSQAPTGDAYAFMEAHRLPAVEPLSTRDEGVHRAIRASDAAS